MKMTNCRVTHSRKCYSVPRVFVCVGCDLLAESNRSHAIICSPACRVRVHRHPETLRRLEALAAPIGITVMDIQDAEAIRRLRPDICARIASGEVEIDDVRAEVWQTFWHLLTQTEERNTHD